MKAAMLYSRMTREGYIPSLSLRVQMHVVKLAELPVSADVLFDTISEAVRQESYDEAALRDLLRMLVEVIRISPGFTRRVVDLFVEARGPDYHLPSDITVYLTRTLQKDADTDSAQHRSPQPSAPSPTRLDQPATETTSFPYANLLHDLAASEPSFEVYKWTLERMHVENVQSDLAFFNMLLVYEVGRRNFEVVFAIYHLLMQKRTATVKPSAHTFSTVFRALSRLSGSHRYRRANHIRVPSNVPSARSVYKDLLTCHLEHTHPKPNQPSPSLDPIVLHKALRTFLARRDYAAAYTAVRAFRLFPAAVGAPTLATYRLVFGALLGRVRAQFPGLAARIASALSPEKVWTFRFLGMHHLPPHLCGTLPLDLSVVHRVLRVGADPRLSLDFVPAPSYAKAEPQSDLERFGLLEVDEDAEKRRVERICDPEEFHPHGMPTPIELTGLKPVSEDRTYKIAPLERVLKRAIAASLSHEDEPLSSRVSEMIVAAKKDITGKP